MHAYIPCLHAGITNPNLHQNLPTLSQIVNAHIPNTTENKPVMALECVCVCVCVCNPALFHECQSFSQWTTYRLAKHATSDRYLVESCALSQSAPSQTTLHS